MTSAVNSAGPTSPAADRQHGATDGAPEMNPWAALSALLIGFFMILVDSTIVSVGTETILTDLHTTLNGVLWVTSGYLLAYAVPLLVTGRMGDRFGAKKLYLAGLAVFTAASAACGFSTTVEALIVCRVVQGLGAAMMAPQTMAIITQIFPAERRGKAMGLWGATAGVATLVGPILGGVLIDHAGWEWIFFVNVPVGVLAFAVAWRFVPALPVRSHSFDVVGVLLSGIALFCIVFGVQEGEQYDWGTITGIISVPLLIGVGVALFAIFIYWQKVYKGEPLVPLHLFANRNFTLANVAITTVGFAVTAMSFPLMIHAQGVLGFTPTEAALLLAPMAVLSGALAPMVGGFVDKYHPAVIAGTGLSLYSISLFLYGFALHSDTAVWRLLLISSLMGVANAFMWAPLSVTATRTLPRHLAGAGSGIYNTTRQLGSVLGSAAIAALMDARLSSNVGESASAGGSPGGGQLPAAVAEPFARAMGESLFLPASVVVIGVLAVAAFTNPHPAAARAREAARAAGAGGAGGAAGVAGTNAGHESAGVGSAQHTGDTGRARSTDATSAADRPDAHGASRPATHAQPEAPVHAVTPTASAGSSTPAAEPAGASIAGLVTGAAGSPLAGARVTVADQGGRQVAQTATGPDGSYSIGLNAGGTYLLIVAAAGVAPSAGLVSVGDRRVRRDVSLAGPSGLSGRVLAGGRGETLGVADALVTLTDAEGRVAASTRTSSAGTFDFPGLTAGAYVLTAQAGTRAPQARSVDVTAATATSCDITLGGGGGLSGTVLGPDGRALPHSAVTVVDASGCVVSATTTDADGRYSCVDLPAGPYTVTASGYAPVAVGVAVTDDAMQERSIRLGSNASPGAIASSRRDAVEGIGLR